VNYYTCTRSYKDKFVEELIRITEEIDNEKEKEEMREYCAKNPGLLLKKSKSGGKEEPAKKEKKEAAK
jgi:uncharacterized membrane-anchored protein YhcB (DUF1043 family)